MESPQQGGTNLRGLAMESVPGRHLNSALQINISILLRSKGVSLLSNIYISKNNKNEFKKRRFYSGALW
jgi:hypothetical protein